MKGVLLALLLACILPAVLVLGSKLPEYVPSNVAYTEHNHERSARLYTADLACAEYAQERIKQFDSQAVDHIMYGEYYVNCIREFFPRCEVELTPLRRIEKHTLFVTNRIFFVNMLGLSVRLDPSLPPPSEHLAEFAQKNLPSFSQLYQANVWQVKSRFDTATQPSSSSPVCVESTEGHLFCTIFWRILTKTSSIDDALQYKKGVSALLSLFWPGIFFRVVSYPVHACGVQIAKEFVNCAKNSPIVQGFEIVRAGQDFFLGPPTVYAYADEHETVVAKFETLGKVVVAKINQLNYTAIKTLTRQDFVAAKDFSLNAEVRFLRALVPELFDEAPKA